jgi:hypothetical protein
MLWRFRCDRSRNIAELLEHVDALRERLCSCVEAISFGHVAAVDEDFLSGSDCRLALALELFDCH